MEKLLYERRLLGDFSPRKPSTESQKYLSATLKSISRRVERNSLKETNRRVKIKIRILGRTRASNQNILSSFSRKNSFHLRRIKILPSISLEELDVVAIANVLIKNFPWRRKTRNVFARIASQTG